MKRRTLRATRGQEMPTVRWAVGPLVIEAPADWRAEDVRSALSGVGPAEPITRAPLARCDAYPKSQLFPVGEERWAALWYAAWRHDAPPPVSGKPYNWSGRRLDPQVVEMFLRARKMRARTFPRRLTLAGWGEEYGQAFTRDDGATVLIASTLAPWFRYTVEQEQDAAAGLIRFSVDGDVFAYAAPRRAVE